MAKAVKTKKAKEPVIENTESVTETPITEETSAAATVIMATTIEQPTLEAETGAGKMVLSDDAISYIPETKEEIPEIDKVVQIEKTVDLSPQEEMSMEDKISSFLQSRTGEVRMNDFLKSLFPIPKHNEPPILLLQSSSRVLRKVLDDMQSKGQIIIINNLHHRLGDPYYPDSTTGKTEYYNLNTLQIQAKV